MRVPRGVLAVSGVGLAALALLPIAPSCAPDEPSGPPTTPSEAPQPPSLPDQQSLLEGGPPRRRALAGRAGLRSVSRVVFESAPNAPHRLMCDYAFPARGAWILEAESEARAGRVLEWRYGARSFHLRAGQERAVEYADADRERVLRRFDLRQALIDWPHGLEWREESPGRLRAEASSGSEADLPFAAGSFVAELDAASGLPLALSSLDQSGAEEERYVVLGWSENSAAPRVTRAQLWARRGDELGPVWTEELHTVDYATRLVEPYFLPPHLRPTTQSAGLAQTTEVRLQERLARSLPLSPAPTSWDEGLSLARELHATEAARLEPLGLELEPALVLELDLSGLPSALELRLSSAEDPLPGGYERLPSVQAWSLMLGAGISPDSSWVGSMAAAASWDPQQGPRRLWARVLPASDGSPGGIQLVLCAEE